MRNQCISILNEARGEMQAYSDQRSEQWRDSERGEALVEMMESMAEVAEALQEIDIK